MKSRNVLLSVLVGLGVASCGENNPPPTKTDPTLTTPKPYGQFTSPESPANPPIASNTAPQVSTPQIGTPMGAAPTGVQASSTPPKSPIPASPVPPKNAQWTIACDTIEGAGHTADAELQKQHLIQTSHMADWYVIHTETKSEIYYGYYGAFDKDPAEKRRQETDRQRILALLDRLGNPMVRGAILTPVTLPDPSTPPDWNLLNTPRDAYWTIEFATFVDSPDLRAVNVDRKQAAVEVVRHYREELHATNVYYYHGPSVSSVCVGAWKREAMAEQGINADKNGNMRDDVATPQSSDQPLLVIPDIVPPNMPSRVLEPGTNKPMAVQALKREVLDPDMQAMMVKFHDHLVNGHYEGQEANGVFTANPSMFVQIPHDASHGSMTDENWRLTGGSRQPAAQPRPQGGDDMLRSIGSH